MVFLVLFCCSFAYEIGTTSSLQVGFDWIRIGFVLGLNWVCIGFELALFFPR
jgi:hypothetical protein